MSVDKGRELVLDRISPEIFLAKQSAAIWQCIGEYSSQLNGTTYQDVFGIIQRQSLSSLVLSLGKLFERPDKKYPNCSIPTAIEQLKAEIQAVRMNTASVGKLVEDLTDVSEKRIHLLQNIDEIPQILLNHFEEYCPREPARPGSTLDESFERVKVVRDKRAAHLEDIDISTLPKADWDGVTQLLAFGESFVNLVGYGFFGFSRKGRVDAEDLELRNEPSGNQIRWIIESLTL